MDPERLSAIIAFIEDAARLKDTLRSGRTNGGRRESTAEHTWRLCLLALLIAEEARDVDPLRLLKICIVHDLGEAISGDVPAIHQSPDDNRAVRERADLQTLSSVLPDDLATEIMGLWDEYHRAASPEAVLAKGLDKIETMLQHNSGRNPADFDYAFNLTYGRQATDRLPLLRQMRNIVDLQTRRNADKS